MPGTEVKVDEKASQNLTDGVAILGAHELDELDEESPNSEELLTLRKIAAPLP